ncbi:MAG: hypothetical protein A2063_06195 [Gallionellales bacterium GWA2_60_142]|nr:MAG: hypothetical protein A2063_06195 [Gallionellales bacterium GWA2_60_142]HCI12979.1 hypothetical protein [Gallionellaceae bacterium]
MIRPLPYRSLVLVFALVLSACASNDQTRVTDAATSPLNDLNLIRTKIPQVLLDARKQPYAIPPETDCAELLVKVQELDVVLGPDLDTSSPSQDPSLADQGADLAKNAAIGALRSTSENIIPFRGWVRRLSGAERHSQEVAAAIVAGTVRRAFIKGLMAAKPCAHPCSIDK